MSKQMTPEKIGRMLERGEISREEAIEMMDALARQEALQDLYGQRPESSTTAGLARPLQSENGTSPLRLVALGVAMLLVFAVIVAGLIYLWRSLTG